MAQTIPFIFATGPGGDVPASELDTNFTTVQTSLTTITTIASNSTTDLGSLGSNNLQISGTTNINSFGASALTTQPLYFVTFTGILTLVYNGTSMILPSGSNITTAAGDSALVWYLGSGNWQVLMYYRASGTALVASSLPPLSASQLLGVASGGGSPTAITLGTNLSMSGATLNATAGSSGATILLGTATASNSATLDFTSLITSAYDYYFFIVKDLTPVGTNVTFQMRYSTNNGSSYVSGSSYSNQISNRLPGTANPSNFTDSGTTAWLFTHNTGPGPFYGKINLIQPLSSIGCNLYWEIFDNSGNLHSDGVGNAPNSINAVRFLVSSGNISSGVIEMYGTKNT